MKVPAVSPEQVVMDLAVAMEPLAKDARLRVRMGNGARQRVHEHFDWDKKGEFMMQVYRGLRPGIAYLDANVPAHPGPAERPA